MRPPRDWELPGAFTVAPGVHRIPLPLTDAALHTVNVYAVEDGAGVTLIDAGIPTAEGRAALIAGLGQLGMALSDIRQVLVTHLHSDHYGQASSIRTEVGATISLGDGERVGMVEALRPGRDPLGAQLDLLERAGAQPVAERLSRERPSTESASVPWYSMPDSWLHDTQLIELENRSFRVVHTPGHTHGHVVLFDADAGVLLAGDHVLPHITPSIGFEPKVPEQPLRDYLWSLARVRAMPDAALLPAHGGPAASVHARVDELLDHHDVRLRQVEAGVEAAGTMTAYELAGELTWTRRNRRLEELDAVNQMLAVLETATHLDLLADRGSMTSSTEAGVRRYTAASGRTESARSLSALHGL